MDYQSGIQTAEMAEKARLWNTSHGAAVGISMQDCPADQRQYGPWEIIPKLDELCRKYADGTSEHQLLKSAVMLIADKLRLVEAYERDIKTLDSRVRAGEDRIRLTLLALGVGGVT